MVLLSIHAAFCVVIAYMVRKFLTNQADRDVDRTNRIVAAFHAVNADQRKAFRGELDAITSKYAELARDCLVAFRGLERRLEAEADKPDVRVSHAGIEKAIGGVQATLQRFEEAIGSIKARMAR